VVLPQFIDFKIGNDMAKKNSKRREWTKTDIRELKTLARAKTPAGKIARALKRTEGATRQKAFSLEVSLDSRG
jgi:NADH:ubiquinone oxidoreductase subunit